MEEDNDDQHIQAPSSDGFRQDNNYSPALIQRAERRLSDEEACQCGATRTVSLSCGSEGRARHMRMALSTPHLSLFIDPQVVLPGEPHSLSIAQFMTSRHVKNPSRGDPPPGGTFIKLARFPFETLPRGDTAADNLPVEAYFLGSWLGDGSHDQVRITSVDLDETRGYLAGYVRRLNASRPDGAAPLHLRITPHIFTEGSGQLEPNMTCFDFAIASTFRGQDGFYWNPLRGGLQALGIFGNHKARWIPMRYLNASEEARAALLAGLIDTDGSLICGTIYEFSQSVDHRQVVEPKWQLAESSRIKAIGRLYTTFKKRLASDGV